MPSSVTERSLVWHSEADTRAFARGLARRVAARPSVFIALHGDLGAGKTTFVRHLLHALGVAGRIKSPTYTLVEPYRAGQLSIWHCDFYRFDDPREWAEAGLRDVFAGPGLKLAEWPEKAAPHIPRADLAIKMEAMSDQSRRVELSAGTALGQELLA